MTYKERARKFWKGGANIEKIAELLRSVAEEEREKCATELEALGDRLCDGLDAGRAIRARKEKQ